ncbi:AP endonuclease [Cucurbitaria berberidis CBS 394.84]|uniref:Apurinic-apyrimidinic endonuclease 1 n=1 Tax=Cucurbitaria berberidis CBS 394.84 TaxID=1168544 RepID=A0A9P4GNB6_9PLEO|nr:AP endonuclease [Cucurbitaria berberidis CBS 394.84]KAF1848349.1 AP endonuclease [Cucurbitaria berberidis CBS 394.84]
MAKKLPKTTSDSSLSPLPSNFASVTEQVSFETRVSGKKRKAETTIDATKRIKKAPAPSDKPEDAVAGAEATPRPKRRATKEAIVKEETIDDRDNGKTLIRNNKSEDESGDDGAKVKKTTTRKTRNVKNMAPIAERTKDTKLRVGAHVSSAGGVQNAIVNLISIGGNAFAMFLKNHKKWESKDLDPEHANLFIDRCKENSICAADCCLPHGSYLVNLAHPDPERKKQAYGSFLNDLTRCHKLGIRLYNFHPGNANATTREEGIKLIAENINQAHKDPATGGVITVLETMASLGNTIGGTFKDLAAIIELVKDQSRVGVCLDTCHVFAAGYDLRTRETYAQTMEKFDKEIGFEYLKAFHINDSKAPLSSHRDLHARIGTGYLGLRAFHNIVNDERFHGLPMVLETPVDVIGEDGKKTEDKGIWAREIKMLERLVGMDVESNEFKELEAKLQEEGTAERDRIGGQVERKKIKDANPKRTRAKKQIESEDVDDMED